MEVISVSQAKINNYYWMCSYWEVILLITCFLSMWMLKHFYRTVCSTSLNHGCGIHTCSNEAIHKYQIFLFLIHFSNLVKNMIPYIYPLKWFSLGAQLHSLKKGIQQRLTVVLFLFCFAFAAMYQWLSYGIWNSNKGWKFDICDNLASYCTCALWKYFSNSYFLNLSWHLHLLSNRRISR